MGCQEAPPTQTDLYIFLDYTEGQHYDLEEDVDKYFELMNITEENNRNFGQVRVFPIYDVASSVSQSVKLKEGKSKLEGNKYLRQKELDAFKTKLVGKVESFNNMHTGKSLKASHIFQPISKGMKKMEKSDADRKVMLIYSDMLENSQLANMHGAQLNFTKVKTNFDQHWKGEDISDIEMYIVYPIDKNNDTKIRKAGEIWRQYLMEKGMDEELVHFDTSIDI